MFLPHNDCRELSCSLTGCNIDATVQDMASSNVEHDAVVRDVLHDIGCGQFAAF